MARGVTCTVDSRLQVPCIWSPLEHPFPTTVHCRRFQKAASMALVYVLDSVHRLGQINSMSATLKLCNNKKHSAAGFFLASNVTPGFVVPLFQLCLHLLLVQSMLIVHSANDLQFSFPQSELAPRACFLIGLMKSPSCCSLGTELLYKSKPQPFTIASLPAMHAQYIRSTPNPVSTIRIT
jgi:hypothetical protein